jgi:hypothetical protein
MSQALTCGIFFGKTGSQKGLFVYDTVPLPSLRLPLPSEACFQVFYFQSIALGLYLIKAILFGNDLR